LGLLFVLFTLLYSIGNEALPFIDRDEPRFAEASREMRASGDYIIPRVNGEYRFDKPPLIYWLQVAAIDLLGDNEFAARFPSVLFAAATVVATAVWGSRLYSPKTGLWAGLIFGLSFQLFIHARAAVADFPMIFCFLVATWSAWERRTSPRSAWLFWTFYLALGIGFLAKGPIALLPIVFPLLYRLMARESGRVDWASALAGLVVILAVIGAWGVPALVLTRGEFFAVGIGHHVVERAVAPLQSHGAHTWVGYLLGLPFYFLTFFFSFFPGWLFVPAAIRRLRNDTMPVERYLLIAAGCVFLVFTLIQTKLPHYTLPALPFLSLLVAPSAVKLGWSRTALVITLATYALVALVGFRVIAPYFATEAIVEPIAGKLEPDTRIATTGYDEPSLIWSLRKTARPFLQRLRRDQVEGFLQASGSAVCVVTDNDYKELPPNPNRQEYRAGGYDFSRWKMHPIDVLGRRVAVPFPEPVTAVVLYKRG
jgi:4-amino-4-deoxy-L-arabinose transferase-like glycosyltransferase